MDYKKNMIDKDNMLRVQQQRHFARYRRVVYCAKTNNEFSELYTK